MNEGRNQWVYTLLGYILILVILVLIALIIGVGVYWMASHGFRPSHEALVKWVGFAVFTPTIFGWTIKGSRWRWRNKVFWATIGSLLFVHILAFWVLQRYIEHWSMLWFAIISTAEVPLLMTVVEWATHRFGREHHAMRSGASHIGKV